MCCYATGSEKQEDNLLAQVIIFNYLFMSTLDINVVFKNPNF